MVDYRNAFSTEDKIYEILKRSKRLAKYKLELHSEDQYGVDIQATAPGYEDFAIELESTQGSKWPSDAPYPVTWKKFSVPVRKRKFYERHPMSLFVKVTRDLARAVVIPMSYVCASETDEYPNQTDNHCSCNDFYLIFVHNHPALCFCKIEKLSLVIDEQFKYMSQMKKMNDKYTDMRPVFKRKERNKK